MNPYAGQMAIDPMFDSVAYTQGNMPHLLELLWNEYTRYLQFQISEKARAGQKPVSLDKAIEKAPAQHFYSFCVNYLTNVRPAEQFAVDMNVGLKLSNHVRCVVSPGTTVQGTMQDSSSVGITSGMSQPGLGGTTRDGAIPII